MILQFIFGLLLPCVFISGVTGFSIETNWIFLWICLPMMLLSTKVRMTPAHWIGLAYLGWALASFAWSPSIDYSIEAALRLGTVMCAFLLGAEINDKWIFRGLAWGVAINSIVAIIQYFGPLNFSPGPPSGLLYNGNALAEPAALVALVMFLDGPWLLAFAAAPAIYLPQTRAGFLILGVGFSAWLWQRSRYAAVLLVIVVTSLGILTLVNGYRVPSTQQRVAIWKDTSAGLTTTGWGLGSFGHSYPRFATHIDTAKERPYHAHSDFLEVTFELGIPGLLLFIALAGTCFLGAAPRERILLAACLAISLVDFPLYVPTSAFIVAFVAGRAASGWHEHGLQWFGRRLNLDAWAIRAGLLRPNPSVSEVPV